MFLLLFHSYVQLLFRLLQQLPFFLFFPFLISITQKKNVWTLARALSEEHLHLYCSAPSSNTTGVCALCETRRDTMFLQMFCEFCLTCAYDFVRWLCSYNIQNPSGRKSLTVPSWLSSFLELNTAQGCIKYTCGPKCGGANTLEPILLCMGGGYGTTGPPPCLFDFRGNITGSVSPVQVLLTHWCKSAWLGGTACGPFLLL